MPRPIGSGAPGPIVNMGVDAEVVTLPGQKPEEHPSEGLFRRGALDLDGVRTVLELRRRHAQLPRDAAEPARYVDLRWYDQALGG